MAPQLIFEENPHYSIKCDVWSVGVVIYFVIMELFRFYMEIYLGEMFQTFNNSN